MQMFIKIENYDETEPDICNYLPGNLFAGYFCFSERNSTPATP